MNVSLDDEQASKIKEEFIALVFPMIRDAIKKATVNPRPYLNRKDMAIYLGVSESTIGIWVKHGMPVAVIDGRKLYGKQTVTQWLKDHEKTVETSSQHKENKKPATIAVVTSK